jgi:hypothetical protein
MKIATIEGAVAQSFPRQAGLPVRITSKRPFVDYAAAGRVPSLVIDIENGAYIANGAAGVFSDVITFSRSGTATYADKNGVLQTAASGVARNGHHIYRGGKWSRVMRIEPQAATNQLTRSNEFDHADWAATGLTGITSGFGTVPGTIWRMVEDGVSGTKYLRQNYSFTAGQQAVFSAWFAPGPSRGCALRISGAAFSSSPNATLNADGTLTVANADHGYVEEWGSIKRVVLVVTPDVTATSNCRIQMTDATGTWSYTGDGTSYVDIFGAQLEDNARAASSYIATVLAAATRNAETVKVPKTVLPDMDEAFSVYLRCEASIVDDNVNWPNPWLVRRISGSDKFYMVLDTLPGTGRVVVLRSTSTGSSASATGNNYLATPGAVSVSAAARVTGAAIQLAVDGVAQAESTTVTGLASLASLDMDIGFQDAIIDLKRLYVWPVDIGDAGIVEISA